MTTTEKIDIVLVGYEPEGSENLSLRLLAAAVRRAGMDARVMTSPRMELSAAVVNRAVGLNPRCMGFSLQDPQNAIHALALASLTRKRGYGGFIVAGGPTATLQSEWVLQRCDAVDGVIRHQGEVPLIGLLSALRSSEPLERIPSLTTRQFENAPSPVPGLPVWRPVRDVRPTVLGVPTAEVIAGRGCHDRCSYCTHAAQASLVTREVRDSGVSAQVLRSSGLGTPIVRPVADLADEMASLYHDQGVRYFNFIDENPVPRGEARALDWIGVLKDEFSSRGMTSLGLGMMTRADRLTGPVVKGLIDLGLIRTLVGVESGCGEGLRRLGRTGDPSAAAAGLDLLAHGGVVTLFNSLLLHPGSQPDDVRSELEFLSSVRGVMFDTVQAMPMVGTELHRTVKAQGRLRGEGPLPSFEVDSPVIDRFRSLMGRFQTRVLGPYNPTFRVNDLLISAVLAQRFCNSPVDFGKIEGQLRRQAEVINRLRVRTLMDCLDAAQAQGLRPSEDLFAQAHEQFREILKTLDEIEKSMEGQQIGWTVARSLKNLAAAATLVFSMSAAQGCYSVSPIENAGTSDTDTDADTDTDTDTNTDTDTDADTDTTVSDCADEEYWNERYALESLLWDNCDFYNYSPTLEVTLDENGAVVSITLPYEETLPVWAAELLSCYNELLEGVTFPCLAGETIWIEGGTAGLVE